MKIKSGEVIKRYNGKPVLTDQEVMLSEDGRPVIINGQPHLTAGREMTVGDVFSTILSTKKVEQFNLLKADVLARRFYRSEVTEIDESDYGSLLDVIESNDQFVPFVLAFAKRALIEARDVHEKSERRKR
jgi:hypothetical protein